MNEELEKLIEESYKMISERNESTDRPKVIFDVMQDDLVMYENWLVSDEFVNPYK